MTLLDQCKVFELSRLTGRTDPSYWSHLLNSLLPFYNNHYNHRFNIPYTNNTHINKDGLSCYWSYRPPIQFGLYLWYWLDNVCYCLRGVLVAWRLTARLLTRYPCRLTDFPSTKGKYSYSVFTTGTTWKLNAFGLHFIKISTLRQISRLSKINIPTYSMLAG